MKDSWCKNGTLWTMALLFVTYLPSKKKKSDLVYHLWGPRFDEKCFAIKQQVLGLCCSSPPTNMRSFTVQKGVFDMEIKTCRNPPKCRRSLQSFWIPHWKGLWAFLPIFFSFLFMLTCIQSLALRVSKQPFSFCTYTVLRAVGCWAMTKAPKCSANTDNNKCGERSILRTVQLWLTKWIS